MHGEYFISGQIHIKLHRVDTLYAASIGSFGVTLFESLLVDNTLISSLLRNSTLFVSAFPLFPPKWSKRTLWCVMEPSGAP